ncbi:MAG TPA: hypothetical protein VKU41_15775 [Polyangiaceae bacterium]|nr:hypothetical protein [Polyangiaceae bacterium]
MRSAAALAIFCLIGCGDGGSSGSGGAAGSGSSPSSGAASANATYQTAQGFCAQIVKFTGGDLVGDWTVVGACAISTNSPDNCAQATLSLSLAAQGTITFNADGTGSIDVTANVQKSSVLPRSCASENDASAKDCASLQADLAIEVGAGGGADAGASATCTPSTSDPSACDCVQVFAPRSFRGSGTYKFELPDYLQGPSVIQGGFLVQGNTLRLDGLTVQGTQFDLIAQR